MELLQKCARKLNINLYVVREIGRSTVYKIPQEEKWQYLRGRKKHLPFDVFEPKGPLAYFMFKTLSCTKKW